MRPLRSMICIKSPTKKRSQFPSLRIKKSVPNKFQQFVFQSKAQIILHKQLMPIQISLQKQGQKCMSISLGNQMIKVQDDKGTKLIPLKLSETEKKWIHLYFGDLALNSKIRIYKKTADQNTSILNFLFTSCDQWKKYCPSENFKNICIISLDKINDHQSSKRSIGYSEDKRFVSREQESKNQVKNFVSALMAKKLSKRNTQIDGSSLLKKNGILKRHGQTFKNSFNDYSNNNRQSIDTSTAISGKRTIKNGKLGLNRISRKSNLKQSIFTGKSQKETSAGGQKSILNFGKDEQERQQFHSSQYTLDLDQNQYSRRLKKFETANLMERKLNLQPPLSHEPSIPKLTSHLKSVNQGFLFINNNNTKEGTLESQEQQQVVQEINTQSKIMKKSQLQDTFDKPLKKDSSKSNKNLNQSSSVYESHMVQSRNKDKTPVKAMSDSGSLYESKYEDD